MRMEAAILRREHCIDEMTGQPVQRDEIVAVAALGDDRAITSENAKRRRRLVDPQRAWIWKADGVADELNGDDDRADEPEIDRQQEQRPAEP